MKEWLETGVIDVGILIPPADEFDSFPLFREKLYAVLHAGHPLAEKPVVKVRDFESEAMLICKSGYEPPVVELFQKTG